MVTSDSCSAAEDLVELLQKLHQRLEQLKECSKKKRQAIVNNDVDQVETFTEAISTLNKHIEDQKTTLSNLWDSVLEGPTPRDERPLESILDDIPKRLRDDVRQLQDNIQETLRAVQSVTRENMVLLSDRLENFDRVFDAITETDDDDQYDHHLEEKDSRSSNPMLFDEAI